MADGTLATAIGSAVVSIASAYMSRGKVGKDDLEAALDVLRKHGRDVDALKTELREAYKKLRADVETLAKRVQALSRTSGVHLQDEINEIHEALLKQERVLDGILLRLSQAEEGLRHARGRHDAHLDEHRDADDKIGREVAGIAATLKIVVDKTLGRGSR